MSYVAVKEMRETDLEIKTAVGGRGRKEEVKQRTEETSDGPVFMDRPSRLQGRKSTGGTAIGVDDSVPLSVAQYQRSC